MEELRGKAHVSRVASVVRNGRKLVVFAEVVGVTLS